MGDVRVVVVLKHYQWVINILCDKGKA